MLFRRYGHNKKIFAKKLFFPLFVSTEKARNEKREINIQIKYHVSSLPNNSSHKFLNFNRFPMVNHPLRSPRQYVSREFLFRRFACYLHASPSLKISSFLNFFDLVSSLLSYNNKLAVVTENEVRKTFIEF